MRRRVPAVDLDGAVQVSQLILTSKFAAPATGLIAWSGEGEGSVVGYATRAMVRLAAAA